MSRWRRDREMTCANCDFFFEKGRGSGGECRRFPPTMTAGPMQPAASPRVDRQFWCGEWQRMDVPARRHLGEDSLASALMMMDD